MKIGFDNDKYLSMQSEHIRERIKKFDNKLYLEFGGKLFDDYHASRVLPGFQPDSKLQMLLQLIQNSLHISEAHRAESAQALHKTAHMRAAHIMRQIYSQRHLRHAVLRTMLSIAQLNRPAQALYSHMLQRNIT